MTFEREKTYIRAGKNNHFSRFTCAKKKSSFERIYLEMSFYCVFLVLYKILSKCPSIYLLVSGENLSLKMF